MNKQMSRWSILFIALALFANQTLLAQDCLAQFEALTLQLLDRCADEQAGTLCAVQGTELASGEVLDGIVNVADALDIHVRSNADGPGFAMLNVNANVPGVLGQGIRMVAIGDIGLASLVDPANASTAFTQSAQVTAIVGSNLRSAPSTEARVVGSVVAGTALDAYGLSNDGQWLIVVHEGSSKWVSRQVIAVTAGDINSLPVITGNERTLMQEVLFAASDGACGTAPRSTLLMQGPGGFNSLIAVNGVEMRFTGTILFWMTPDGQMQLIVLDGGATVGNLNVPAGFTMFAPVGADGLVAGDWTGLRPFTQEERAVVMAIKFLPTEVMVREMVVPTLDEVNQTLASINQGALGQTILGPAAAQANCRTFRPTSPLQSMQNIPNAAFFWDGAQGATAYRLTIYNGNGVATRTIDVTSLSTTLTTDTTPDAIGNGSVFAWDVAAIVNGQVACTTPRVTVVRDVSNQPVGEGGSSGPQPTPTACPWASC
jgi:hypothetical protein